MHSFDPQGRLRELERRLGELERRLGDQERRAVNDAQRFALLRLWMIVAVIVGMGLLGAPTRRGLVHSTPSVATAFAEPGPEHPAGGPRPEAKTTHLKAKGNRGMTRGETAVES